MLDWLFSDPLPAGSPAPDFTLSKPDGRLVTLSKLRGKNVVLVFYPGDDTPTCRKQLCEFRDQWEAARERNVQVFGVNPAGSGSHQRFQEKYRFPFPLLVDTGQKVAGLYRANGLFVKRTVYLIDPKGTIRYARRGKPDPGEVLAAAQ
ncbi:MAG TPA: peroxiredoxin [Bryobacteraceae bacterium]|nr:peroxiredoxin [Bryobacteraceae bacterium]